MAQLIAENCYKKTKNPYLSTIDESTIIPDNWLLLLCKKLNQLSLATQYPPFGDWILKKCNGLAETHKLMPHLLKFYRAFTQDVFSEHILDMTLSLLNDWNNECIEGLINIIESSFYFYLTKQNIFEFLHSLRIEIIDLAFNQTNTDNNHTRNRMFTVASVNGYGVEAIHSEDKYPGILSDEYIQKRLMDAFSEHYTPLEIFYKIIEKFITDAKTKFSYYPGKTLDHQSVQDFLFSIKVFFNDKQSLNTYDFCICDAISYNYLDYNWYAIYLYIFKNLIDLQIINIQKQHHQLIENFLKDDDEIASDKLSLLFEGHLISTPTQLNHFFEILPKRHESIKPIIIRQYVTHLIENKHPGLFKALSVYSAQEDLYSQLMDNQALTLTAIFQQFKFTRSLVIADVALFLKNCSDEFLKNLFLFQDEQDKNILILAAINHPNLLAILLEFLNKLNLIETTLTHTDKDQFNVLNASLSHHHLYAEQMLKYLKLINVSPEVIINLLETKNIYGQNSLMICVNQHPGLLRNLLNLIEELPIDNKRKLKLFSQSNQEGNNCLMLALNEHVSVLKAIMMTLGKLKMSAVSFHQLCVHKNQLLQNFLYKAASAGEIYFVEVLKKINRLNLSVAEKIALLTSISFQSRNCLYQFGMSQNQVDQKEISILNISSGKNFTNVIINRLPLLSQELQKAFIELLIDLQLELMNMLNDEQNFNPSNSKLPSAVKLHAYLNILCVSYKRSEKTEQEIFKFSKQASDTIFDNSYFEMSNSNCCFSFFHKPNDFEEIIENLKKLFDFNMRLVEHQIRKNSMNLV